MSRWAKTKTTWRGSQDLSVPAERSGSGSRQSGVEHGHHLYKDGAGLRLSGGGDGLVQPLRSELEVVADPGNRFLRRCAEVRVTTGPAGDLQQRSGIAVHQREIHWRAGGTGD